MSRIRTRILAGFDDPTFGPEQWEALLAANGTDVVYLTWPWQRNWWACHPRGRLLLVVAERDGEVIALAPLYAEHGMVYFVGTGFESGHLDFIGDTRDPAVLEALLDAARANTPGFEGFSLHFVPDDSGTAASLQAAAPRLGLSCYDEGDIACPVIEFAARPGSGEAAASKEDMVSHERRLQREGVLEVCRHAQGDTILPELDGLFATHVARWAATSTPSQFRDEPPREYMRRLTTALGRTGWLRFVKLVWNGTPIAFHFGFCYRGRYIYEMSTFAIDFGRQSPGQVLRRQALLWALEEGVRIFDFGIGEQSYKARFATRMVPMRTWGLYRRRQRSDALDVTAGAGMARETEPA